MFPRRRRTRRRAHPRPRHRGADDRQPGARRAAAHRLRQLAARPRLGPSASASSWTPTRLPIRSARARSGGRVFRHALLHRPGRGHGDRHHGGVVSGVRGRVPGDLHRSGLRRDRSTDGRRVMLDQPPLQQIPKQGLGRPVRAHPRLPRIRQTGAPRSRRAWRALRSDSTLWHRRRPSRGSAPTACPQRRSGLPFERSGHARRASAAHPCAFLSPILQAAEPSREASLPCAAHCSHASSVNVESSPPRVRGVTLPGELEGVAQPFTIDDAELDKQR